MPDSPLLVTRVRLKNYKSIASCDLKLGPLTFLVGQNGSGKSNFVDALRFVTDSLIRSLDHALRDRGGINDVRRRSGGHPTHFGVALWLNLPQEMVAQYAFEIAAKPKGDFEVQREECTVWHTLGKHYFRVERGKVEAKSFNIAPPASKDRLYLVAAAGIDEFRPVYDALSTMGFYNLNPESIRELQSPDPGLVLIRDGSNIASVLAHILGSNEETHNRIREYLNRIVPSVNSVQTKTFLSKETLEFRQQVKGQKHPWRFLASNMSDGTLRALGILVALFQSGNGSAPISRLVAIEEPEVALHPGAAAVVRDCLKEASQYKQVIVTSHSPELLDDDQIGHDEVLAVQSQDGVTTICPIDRAAKQALLDKLYTAGELLRMNQLTPDASTSAESNSSTPDLFGNDISE